MLILKIFIELVLAWLVLLMAPTFWQLVKGQRFRRYILWNKHFMDLLFTPEVISRHAARKKDDALSDPAFDIELIIQVDSKIFNTAMVRVGTIMAGVTIISYFCGLYFLVGNLIRFVIWALRPMTKETRREALSYVFNLGNGLMSLMEKDWYAGDNFTLKHIYLRVIWMKLAEKL